MRWAKPALRAVVLLVLVAAVVVVSLGPGLPSRDEVRSLADGLGPWAAPAFVVAYALVCLLPLPKGVMSLAGGAAFGLLAGLPLVLLGSVAGSVLTFALSRWLGRHHARHLIENRLPVRVRAIDERLAQGGFVTILVARLVPVIPYTVLNYALGLTSQRYAPFIAATALGVLPNSVAYVTLAAYGTSPVSWPFGLALLGVLVLASLGVRRQRRVRLGVSAARTGGA
ncbi:TVP38/TMEM64 family protein [Marmoricola endophyticus]|uniref:TVP38/TMEM64 family membrane protein n=1 Tax=Marmoricola endophyticus TaxID=2040280 RepID=A0A917F185_9ACTN|nr:VTT domain-containing protein [Marmoricola endophyticus]GGF32664.1 TVP38/TMEM64 family protein [Marmoricola endophyticus]